MATTTPAEGTIVPGRFLTPPQVAEELNISLVQVRALLTSRQLVGIQIGGRKQWRVERCHLEAYIKDLYEAASTSPEDAS